ncbi:galactokinase [Jatrophihabitans sp. DSM 45814]
MSSADSPARWRSPGRVNLIGEHTDYNDGFCLPLAIAQGCDASVSRLDEDVVEVVSAQRTDPVEIQLRGAAPEAFALLRSQDRWAGYPIGVVWALRQRGHQLGGMSIEINSDVPEGAGLSSSAALACAVAAAVADLFDLGLDQGEVVSIARQAENDFVGTPTGGMDQLASVFGAAGQVLLCDMRTLTVEALPFDLESAGLALLVVDTRAHHQHVAGPYAERRAACEEAARQLGVPALRDITLEDLPDAMKKLDSDLLRKRARHVITENDRTLAAAGLLRTGQLRQVGRLLTASHASLRDDFQVSVPEVDLAVEVMLAFEAYGARMTGGGFGGCAIGLMDPAQARAAAIGLDGAFGGRGYTEPSIFTATASAGTHRLS